VTIRLDHTIVPARDGESSARWFAELFGLAPPQRFSVFWQVTTGNGVDLDFDTYGPDGVFTTGHYSFLVDEADFDVIFGRIRASGIDFWADPGRHEAGTINHHDGGRGVYFPSPDDHLFEIITVPYGGARKG
jgi:catechol 2,3-dioxygenase-like lactoylglutathione lyase family enzyme